MANEKTIMGLPAKELFASGHRACAGCGEALAVRLVLKAAGENIIIANATGCLEVFSTPYPETSWRVPWIHSAFENAAAVGSGIERALKAQHRSEKVLIFGGDGGTFDIGFQALSGAAERGHDVCYVCYDNNAYMNTGIQRSGATPKYAATTTTPAGTLVHGKQEYKKNMPLIMAAHGCYVATANIGYPKDLVAKVRKGIDFPGPAFILLFAPCTTGWGYPADQTIQIAKLAYETNVAPLYEIEAGLVKFSMRPSTVKPVEEFLKTQKRFKHLTPDEVKDVQNHVNEEFEKLKRLEETQVRI